MRGRAAPLQRLPARSMSWLQARARAAMIGRRTVARNGLHRGEIAVRSDGKPSLDYVHAEAVKLVRQAQLFLHVHAAAGGLFAIAQSRVENRDCGLGPLSRLLLQRLCYQAPSTCEAKLIIV